MRRVSKLETKTHTYILVHNLVDIDDNSEKSPVAR